MTFAEAIALIGNRDSKKVQNNTYVIRRDNDTVCIMLHHTNVVILHRDGCVELNSGNWRTVTTKDRINAYAPDIRVSQVKGIWYAVRFGKSAFSNDAVEFYDGMEYNVNNDNLLDEDQADSARTLARVQAEYDEVSEVCPSCSGHALGHCNRCNASGRVPSKRSDILASR